MRLHSRPDVGKHAPVDVAIADSVSVGDESVSVTDEAIKFSDVRVSGWLFMTVSED